MFGVLTHTGVGALDGSTLGIGVIAVPISLIQTFGAPSVGGVAGSVSAISSLDDASSASRSTTRKLQLVNIDVSNELMATNRPINSV